jgi:hypothetical protein
MSNGLIYSMFSGGAPVVDITGSRIGINLQYPPLDNASNITTVPVAQAPDQTTLGIPTNALHIISPRISLARWC